MFSNHPTLRRPAAKAAALAAALAALAGGLHATQASAESSATSVARAAAFKGDDNGGRIVAAANAGDDSRAAPAPSVQPAAAPRGSTAGLAAAPAPGDTAIEVAGR